MRDHELVAFFLCTIAALVFYALASGVVYLLILLLSSPAGAQSAAPDETVRYYLVLPEPADTLVVAPERRCTPYSRTDYYYPASIEQAIIDRDGLGSPYNGDVFTSANETHIEHIVALSEAHDSGLCNAGPGIKRQFASDLDNLALASPTLNRLKGGQDAGEWLPELTSARCWYVAQVVAVKLKYSLTADEKEYAVLRHTLTQCKERTAP